MRGNDAAGVSENLEELARLPKALTIKLSISHVTLRLSGSLFGLVLVSPFDPSASLRTAQAQYDFLKKRCRRLYAAASFAALDISITF